MKTLLTTALLFGSLTAQAKVYPLINMMDAGDHSFEGLNIQCMTSMDAGFLVPRKGYVKLAFNETETHKGILYVCVQAFPQKQQLQQQLQQTQQQLQQVTQAMNGQQQQHQPPQE